MRGLQKLDTKRAKSQKLVDMTQFVLLSARKAGHKSAERNEKNKKRIGWLCKKFKYKSKKL